MRFLENLTAIRLGPGVVSKATLAFGVVEVAPVAVIFTTHDERLRAGALALSALLFGVYHLVNFVILKWFPHLAVLEGAPLVEFYRTFQGTRGFPEAAPTRLSTNPDRPDPLSLPDADQS